MRVVPWNIDGANGSGYMFCALIHKTQLDVVGLCETKTISMDTIEEAWTRAGMECIPVMQTGFSTVPKAVVATLMCPIIRYLVIHIHNDTDALDSGMIQALTVERDVEGHMANTYVSPGTSTRCLTAILEPMIRYGSNATWLIGDLNARARECDTNNNNNRGRAFLRISILTRNRVCAPIDHTYQARVIIGRITPDVVVTNVRGGTLQRLKEGEWEGASGHCEVLYQDPNWRTERENPRPQRTSKTRLLNKNMT